MRLGNALEWKDGSSSVRRAFAWLTRNGMGRHFPGMPIGWYQLHQCAAIDEIERRLAIADRPTDSRLVVRAGNLWYAFRQSAGARQHWAPLGVSCSEIFRIADAKSRR